ncbi:MAG: hypothetical protein WBN96_08410, partial [Gammaproteobacteria bacterium]
MARKDLWYGVLEAGDKTSPVVRDLTLQAGNNHIWLYNHARNTFVEYAQAIVEPKLRELAAGDVSRDELDRAFKTALKNFAPARHVARWESKAASAKPVKKTDDEFDTDMGDDDSDGDEFIDDIDDDD